MADVFRQKRKNPWARPLQTQVARPGRLKRRHFLMLALAAEILGAGFANADRYRPPGIGVEETTVKGHVIT